MSLPQKEECLFQKPNNITIDKKPELCWLNPNLACICAYTKDVTYCEMRWFEYRKRGLLK